MFTNVESLCLFLIGNIAGAGKVAYQVKALVAYQSLEPLKGEGENPPHKVVLWRQCVFP